MNQSLVRAALIVSAAGLLALFAAACDSSDDAPRDAKTMSFELTDAGCVPNTAKAAAGPIVFDVENAGTSKVSELEVLDGDTILGEVENLADGLSGSFSLTLEQGEYTLYCPGGDDEKGTLTVSGKLKAGNSPEVEKAISQYRDYLEKNTAELVVATAPFVSAVEAGDIEKARGLYAPARIPYERIEPLLSGKDPDLAKEIEASFEDIHAALEPYRRGDGFVSYTELSRADTRKLAQKIDALAEELSQVPAQIVGE